MHFGKKSNAMEAKKTRSCVVRLEDIRSTPSRKVNSTVNNPKLNQTDDKKFKGPLKKRPISEVTSPKASSSGPMSSTTKPRGKPGKASIKMDIVETPPPTIAAGRSRRAIKPNPKYASDDMVTPKIIKNVASLGASANKKVSVTEKQRIESTSSSDDFFNKESDNDIIDLDDDDKTINELKDSDDDFSDVDEELLPKRRGRPKKSIIQTPRSIQLSTPSTTPRSISNNKPTSTPTQLQQMRKTFASSVNRPGTYLKRLHESPEDSDNDGASTSKKLLLSTSISPSKIKLNAKEQTDAQPKQTFVQNRKSVNAQPLNGSKTLNKISTAQQHAMMVQEKRKLLLEKTMNKSNSKSPSTELPPNPVVGNKLYNLKKLSAEKQRSDSPVGMKHANDIKVIEKNTLDIPEPGPPKNTTETMPTFTIVNIHDIINKKGDVLISKADTNYVKPETPGPNIVRSTPSSATRGRRKAVHTTTRTEKIESENEESPITHMPGNQKRGSKVILNHTLHNKLATKPTPQRTITRPTPVEKPAPRILNSMVAKKMQPVRPMIANPDDSADESFPLSLGEEDDDDEDTVIGGRQYHNMTNKKTLPTKENSSALNNRMPLKIMHKPTPEKVVISRHGDKIIKKITCFETWYVISQPEDRPPRIIRNQFDMPLIKLANVANEIELPSENWSYKVSLCELSPSVILKSNLTTYTGDLSSQNVPEEDRPKYQPSCVMFRRAVNDRLKSRLPYDRAVIFKNKTFFTNIEGKNVKLVGAPISIKDSTEVEILLQIVDSLTLESDFVETATTVQ